MFGMTLTRRRGLPYAIAAFALISVSMLTFTPPAQAAGCLNMQGVGSDQSRVGAIGKAQLIINRKVARAGRGGVISRRVKCVTGHVRNIPVYSCVITVRFCSLKGAKVRKRFPRLQPFR